MNLQKKRSLASRTLGVGKDRILFNLKRLNDISQAITKQDIRDLFSQGAIMVREIKGRTAVLTRSPRRRAGSVRKKIKNSKSSYVIITRKLRSYIKELKNQSKISKEIYLTIRKEIRAHNFKSKAQCKERIMFLQK